MSPSPLFVAVLVVLALALIVFPMPIVLGVLFMIVVAAVVDALAARRSPSVERTVPKILARGMAAPMSLEVVPVGAARARARQPLVPDIEVVPAEFESTPAGRDTEPVMITATRRGHHVLPPVVVRATGPLRLGRWDHVLGSSAAVDVYPDLPNARRIATAVRQGRFAEPGQRRRGPLGQGTEFETVRDYQPDDDVRQINWVATARVQRPMSNQYRQDTEREVMAVVDAGRLMRSPVAGGTRLDAALDAVVAVAAVADVLGDRCGAVAFDDRIRRQVRPRRAGGEHVVRALHDLEPSGTDSDYDLAFRAIGNSKRTLVVVFTDMLEEAAAGPLLDAVPTLTRRHAVLVVTSADPDLDEIVRRPPRQRRDVFAAAVAVEVLDAREQVAARLKRAGAVVVDAEPTVLAARTVAAYLRLKASARI